MLLSGILLTLSDFAVSGYVYTIVSQAQITSAGNWGLVGIYAKADTNPLFAADKLDVVGAWSYSRDGGLQAFPANTTPQSVAASLEASAHLFPNSAIIYNNFPDRSTADMLALSASVADGVSETWAIRVSLGKATTEPPQWLRISARWKAHPE